MSKMKIVRYLLSIILIMITMSICSCEEAYQEAKEGKENKTDTPIVSSLGADESVEPYVDEIPLFKNENLNRLVEEYTAITVRHEVALNNGNQEEIQELSKKRDDILNQINDLKPTLSQEEQVNLERYLVSFSNAKE